MAYVAVVGTVTSKSIRGPGPPAVRNAWAPPDHCGPNPVMSCTPSTSSGAFIPHSASASTPVPVATVASAEGAPTLPTGSTGTTVSVSYTHLRAHETVLDLVCRLLLEKKKQKQIYIHLHHT